MTAPIYPLIPGQKTKQNKNKKKTREKRAGRG